MPQWTLLPELGRQVVPSNDEGHGYVLALKNCECGSTMALVEPLYQVHLNLILDDGVKVAESYEVGTEGEARQLAAKLMVKAAYRMLDEERIGCLILRLPLPAQTF